MGGGGGGVRATLHHVCMHVCIYIHILMYTQCTTYSMKPIYIYIYIYIWSEREIDM